LSRPRFISRQSEQVLLNVGVIPKQKDRNFPCVAADGGEGLNDEPGQRLPENTVSGNSWQAGRVLNVNVAARSIWM
jgi:hypothetical protein